LKLTDRDVRLVRDIALSHVLSRDQVLALGYFSTVTRANTRIRGLVAEGFLKRLETPYYRQSLYVAGAIAKQIVGERIAETLRGRPGSPRFLQHSLAVTGVRAALQGPGKKWRFELQVSCGFQFAGRDLEIRPDGAIVDTEGVTLVEVDMGHVTPSKYKEKLRTFDAFIRSGACMHHWGVSEFRVLTVTTGQARATSLAKLLPKQCAFSHVCTTFRDLHVSEVEPWS